MSIFRFRSNDFAVAEINGQEAKFYSLSFTVVAHVRKFIQPLTRALMVLLPPNKASEQQHLMRTQDIATKTFKEPDGAIVETTEHSAVEPETLIMEDRRKRAALDELTSAITAPENAGMIGRIIMDSMRDDFPRDEITSEAAEEFAGSMDLTTLVQALKGVFEGNRKLFDPFLKKVTARGDVAEMDSSGIAASILDNLGMSTPTPTPAE